MRSLCLLYTAELKTLYFVICSVEDLFTLNSNKFRMVSKVDGNPQLDICDSSMYSNILKPFIWFIKNLRHFPGKFDLFLLPEVGKYSRGHANCY